MIDILRAVRDHDSGWQVPDAAPTVDPATGAIRDFVGVPAEVKQAVWPRCLEALIDAPWAAALVAHHAISVYDRFRCDGAWTAFFVRMEAARTLHLEATGGTMEALVRDYVYVRLGDLASLAFCSACGGSAGARSVDDPPPRGPASAGGAEPVRLRRADRSGGAVAADRAVPSDEALRAAWRAAPVVMVTGVVVGRTRTS